jgi:uncharacterized membrane protein
VKVYYFASLNDIPVVSDSIIRVAPNDQYYHYRILRAVQFLCGIIVLIPGPNVHYILSGVVYVLDVSVVVFYYVYN